MSQSEQERIEEAARDITGAFGYFSPGYMRGESGRIYNDRRISAQIFSKDDGPNGYSVLVTAPDESRHIVYLRKPRAMDLWGPRPGLWTEYLKDLQAEALSVPERKRRWEATLRSAHDCGDQTPIDDSAIFADCGGAEETA